MALSMSHSTAASIHQDIPLAFTPEFVIFLHVTPLACIGITKAETPFAVLPPVRTAAMQ
jgi:hypothetical protein